MSVSRWLDQSHLFNKKYDIVIVGAGVAGLSTAYWLQKKHPRLKIAIVDKSQLASGASGRNAGFVTCGSIEHFMKLQKSFGLKKAIEIWKFSETNHQLLKNEIIKGHIDTVDYRNTGACTVAPNLTRWKLYKKAAQLMRENGIEVEEVGPKEMQKDYGVTGFVGGIEYKGDGYVHPYKLLTLLRSQLKIDFYENCEVFRVAEGAPITISTDKGVFECESAFFTLNAYLPLVLEDFKKLIVPGRGQILMTEPLPQFVKGPCYLTKHLCYFRQLPTGHLLIGGFRNLDSEGEKTYADGTTDLIQNALFQFVKKRFKPAANAKVAYRWSGIMGYTPDGQMIIGSHPKNKNMHIMAGCSGHGMGLSFHAAKVLVDSFDGQRVPSHLSIERYKSKIN